MTDDTGGKPRRDMSVQSDARKRSALQRRISKASLLLIENGYSVLPPAATCAGCRHPAAAHGLGTLRCYYGSCSCSGLQEQP